MWMATLRTGAIQSPCSTVRLRPFSHSRAKPEGIKTAGNWIAEQAKAGVMPHEFGIFVRSEAELDRAKAAVTRAGMASRGSFGASARSRPCSLPSDFIVRVDDGRGADDPLNFIVEI